MPSWMTGKLYLLARVASAASAGVGRLVFQLLSIISLLCAHKVVTCCVCVLACSLPYPPPIRTSRAGGAEQSSSAGAASANNNNSNYSIPAHVPPGYILSSAELYESPSAVTRAYQRNTATAGDALSTLSKPASAAGGAGAAGIGAGAVLTNPSSDGAATATGLPLSTVGSSAGGRQKVLWGKRTPLRKDASW